MVKQELIDRSPVRFFEKALNGGIKPGEIGVLASKKGVGKTSVLVQLGLDGLLQGKQVVHVSFDQHTSYTMTWYEDIFTEMSKKKNLEKAIDVKDDVIRNRTVLNFNQDSVSTKQIITTLTALAQGGIKTEIGRQRGIGGSENPEHHVGDRKIAHQMRDAEAGMLVAEAVDQAHGIFHRRIPPRQSSYCHDTVFAPECLQKNVKNLQILSNQDFQL